MPMGPTRSCVASTSARTLRAGVFDRGGTRDSYSSVDSHHEVMPCATIQTVAQCRFTGTRSTFQQVRRVLQCDSASALGGTRTPNLLIRTVVDANDNGRLAVTMASAPTPPATNALIERARRRPRARLPVPDRRARTRRACCRRASGLALVLAAEAVVSHDAQGPGQRQDAWPGGARQPRSARLLRCGAEHGLGHGHQRAPYGQEKALPLRRGLRGRPTGRPGRARERIRTGVPGRGSARRQHPWRPLGRACRSRRQPSPGPTNPVAGTARERCSATRRRRRP